MKCEKFTGRFGRSKKGSCYFASCGFLTISTGKIEIQCYFNPVNLTIIAPRRVWNACAADGRMIYHCIGEEE